MHSPVTEIVACRLCGQQHRKPGPFRIGTATEATRGGWWCRDSRACRARISAARPPVAPAP